jgi:Fungal specific transcription factor domain
MDYESMFGGQQAWPLELFQAVLLTLIFSLYRTDKRALSKVKLLRSTFITILRELGAFDSETLADHLETYFGGSYVPYTLSMHEQFKRLLVSTYQFDTYFALTHTTPPILHRQEMGVELPSSFALWNTYNVDLLIQRMTEEPPGRIRFQVCEMTNLPGSFTSSQLLVEDVQLGLCGLLQAIW